ncbi:MAG: prolyl oligopeptidase family serine peptidase [Bacteroidales bacterium]
MIKQKFLTVMLMTVSLCAFGQKKPLDHSVYDGWKNIGGFGMTEDARFTLFYINAQEGDGCIVAHNLKTGEQNTISRGASYKLTFDGKYAACKIKPKFEESKTAMLKKVKADKMPKDTLGIYNLYTKELKKYPYLKDFKMGKEGKFSLAFQTTPPADTSKSKKTPKKDKDEGSDLIVYQFASGFIDTLKYVTDYDYSKGGDSLFFVRRPNSKDSLYKAGLYIYIPKTKSLKSIYDIDLKQTVKLPLISDDSKCLAFYARLDTAKAKSKNVSILFFKEGFEKAKVVLDNNSKGLPKNWQISENRSLQFDKKAGRLFFGISPVRPEKDTTIVESEVAKLDIWHYAEPYIQPYQLMNAQRELKKSYLSTIDLNGDPIIVQLATDSYQIVQVPNDWSGDWAFSASGKNYELESQWSANPHRDLYIISVKDGSSKLLLKDVYIINVSSSPDAKYLVWFNNVDQEWYSYEAATGQIRNITKDITVPFADELHDTPEMAPSYGHGGWAEGDKAFYIYDRYDVWQIDPKGELPAVNLTDGLGRIEKKTFRIVRLDEMLLPPGTPGIKLTPLKPKETIYFSVFDNITKDNGYYFKEVGKKKVQMKKWVLEPYTFMYLTKAKDGSVITYTKHNFTTSPELWVTRDNFKTQQKYTDINPQQRNYIWGTNELVKWKSATGLELEGILHKPENFDPSKKYPMIVYFYERNSQYLNYYRAPAPSQSTINIPYFVSNGYLVFLPDIYYQIGHPGKSALDCIVPGVEMLCKNSWVDRDNIAIQGQSWGGYQVAYMVTQPQVFKWKAAGAGAPVSNMTSAYGGIRWGEGVVRQFQYEHTQSRIGKTLWDGLDLYIENSPLFHADKIETPLLIMANDQDEAVPWYQGIEYFTALRRLGKPVWMLQYNKESHNLSERVNEKDLSIRLSQFFDHFLKGAPMPVWMKTGVPATLKGIDWGLEIVE